MPLIVVLAGVNGAGRSSVAGEAFRAFGNDYFNPDEVSRQILEATGCTVEEANARAWEEGRKRLEEAIRTNANFALESTLGGNTITALLRRAAQAGFEVMVIFIGLATPEQHIERVRARVAAGGHDIPERKIRERWNSSRRNLIALMPFLTELRVFDNSAERSSRGAIPPPKELLHLRGGAVIAPRPELLPETPEWAKPIVACALSLARRRQDV